MGMANVDPDNETTFRCCVIHSDQHETEAPKQAIIEELKRCHFCDSAIFAVKLALEEALTNAVRHGNRGDPTKTVTVRYAVTPEKAVVLVRDEGGGFTPEDIPDPTTPERLPLPSGRGIMLMRAYMDEVHYRDNGREVYFVKRRMPPSDRSTGACCNARIRRTLHFSGRVQGVGFRFAAQSIAGNHRVTGYVRNLPDGRVELVVEGTEPELDSLQRETEAEMRGYIESVETRESPATGEFSSFGVAR